MTREPPEAIERLPESRFTSLPMSRLYLEDLERLAAVFESERSDLRVGGYRIRDSTSLASVPIKETYSLAFQLFDPMVSLTTNISSANLYLADATHVKSLGIAKSVEDILAARRPWYWHFIGVRLHVLLYLLLPLSVVFVALFIDKFTKSEPAWGFLVLGLVAVAGLVLVIVGYFLSTHRYTVIRFSLRDERLTFLERNRDQLVLVMLGALAGAVAAWGVTAILGQT